MSNEEKAILRYLAKNGIFKKNREELPGGSKALVKIQKETEYSLEKLYEAAKSLFNQGLIDMSEEREIGSIEIFGVQVEITLKGIAYIKDHPEILEF